MGHSVIGRRLGWAGCAVVVSMGVSACTQSAPATGEVSRKLYSDAQSLADDADVIVRGTLGAVTARTVDSGGSTGGLGVPTAIYTVAVKKAVPVNGASAIISLAWVDTDKLTTDAAAPLVPGQDYIFFLERLDTADRGGLKDFGTLYVPISSNAGVFPIVAGQARATDREFVRVSKSGPLRERVDDRLSVSVDELLALKTG